MAKNEEHYDAIVSFDEPIMIQDDNGELHTIYGILYNQKRRHHDDLFLWEVNRYITYLMGCSRFMACYTTSNKRIISSKLEMG